MLNFYVEVVVCEGNVEHVLSTRQTPHTLFSRGKSNLWQLWIRATYIDTVLSCHIRSRGDARTAGLDLF